MKADESCPLKEWPYTEVLSIVFLAFSTLFKTWDQIMLGDITLCLPWFDCRALENPESNLYQL